ncbi:hypothetical protein QFC19_007473 [Naganishia cerealis]|uniref:Uncharacterized protein n=1 Tax=Naganishia cerealis TaxID=610337 RepID=A0ACC2VA13_9TREE|nr:hypothetical protein QFC19_007473 [Naganishia cerealis]
MSSAEKKRQYSLRRLFLHRKASSISAISAPWGLTVASFRPAPLPSAGGSTPDLRQLSLENTMLVSRESDSNGLLAQRRARDMPVPLHRSASLGYPTSSDVPAVTKRYEASTMCEKFVLPRPRLVALTITPPSSPQGEAAAQSTSYTTQPEVARIGRRSALLVEEYERERGRDSPSVLSGFRVMRQGRERDSEREEWAEKTRAATMSTAAGHGGGLRMRLPSATRETERDQDHKYLMARFAPQPVAYERVHGLDDTSRQNDNNDDEVVPPPFPLSRRKKGRSGSLGNLIAGPFMKKDRVATNSGTGTRSSADPPSLQQHKATTGTNDARQSPRPRPLSRHLRFSGNGRNRPVNLVPRKQR